MSLTDDAARTGEAIRAFAGPALEGEGAPGPDWTERRRGEDRLWIRREAAGPSWFVSQGALAGPVERAAALIKEADLGGLAGDLRRWRVFRGSPCLELVSYASRLPWPLADRSFGVLERYGGRAGEACILGQDTVGDALQDLPPPLLAAYQAERAEPGTVGGSVICSAYRFWTAGSGCLLRRLTRIELHLPLPGAWTEALLGRTFLDDLQKLRRGLAAPPEGLHARMSADPIYGVWAG